MSTRLSLPITLAVALAVGQSSAQANDWLSLSQPEFITASFEAPAPEAEPPAASCELGACDSCNRTDCRCGCWTPAISIEATFLWPTLDATSTFTQAFDLNSATSTNYWASVAGTEDLSVAPRIWIGAKRNCWGVGVRYWTLEQAGTVLDPIAFDPDRFIAGGALEAYTIDLEVTRDFCAWCSEMQLSLGARYGWLQSAEQVNSSSFAAGSVLSPAYAYSNRQFGGTGLTLGWQGTRPLRHHCHLNFYWNLRGSILWGDGSAYALAGASAASGAASGLAEDWAYAGGGGDMFIGEIQVGLQYERQLSCAPCKAFVRGAVEYQYWDTNADVYAAAIAGAAVNGLGSGAVATAGDTEMDLIGFTLGTGLIW